MKRLAVLAALAGAAVLSAPVAAADSIGFTSPSGNIGCMLTDDLLRCDINDPRLVASPAPR